jgi:hypothetical protein
MLFDIYIVEDGIGMLRLHQHLPWGDAVEQTEWHSRNHPERTYKIFQVSPYNHVATWRNGREQSSETQ